MIINLRGTNGSGKSTVARALATLPGAVKVDLATYYTTPRGKPRRVEGYGIQSLDLVVVGKYETPCGGADGIPTQALVKQSVMMASQWAKHVFFEGVIVSTLYSGYLELSKELQAAGQSFVWAYLDTPVHLCLQRIQERNGGKPIKEGLVTDKWRAIWRTQEKATAAGERTIIIDHRRAVEQVMELLI